MPETRSNLQRWSQNPGLTKGFFIAGALLFLITGFIWWNQVYKSPQNVFWGMLDNSFSTASVTRTVVSQGSVSAEQRNRVSYSSPLQSHGFTEVVQKDGSSETKIVTENIGTRERDYVRYVNIDTSQKNKKGQPLDFSGIIGTWAAIDSGQQLPTFLSDAIGGLAQGTMPFSNLPLEKRQELIQFIKDKKVFEPLFDSVISSVEGGHKVNVYKVKINPASYIQLMKRVLELHGLSSEGIDPSGYEGAPAVDAEFSIDPVSRQLKKLKYVDNGYEERYGGYGISNKATVPEDSIPESELTARWQSILAGE